MPKDNHSLMQHYLDGVKNNFFTFFFVREKNSTKLKNNNLLGSYSYLKNKNLNDISFSQFNATKQVFRKKKFLLEVLLLIIGMKRLLGNYLYFLY